MSSPKHRDTMVSKRKKKEAPPPSNFPKPRPLRFETETRLGSIEVPHSLRAVLLDFTLSYFIESPKDVIKFGYKYFKTIKNRKSELKKQDVEFEDSYSDNEVPATSKTCHRCKKEIKPCQGCNKMHTVCRSCTTELKADPACVMSQLPVPGAHAQEHSPPPRQERRDCVFAEGVDDTLTNDWVPPVYEKTMEQKTKLVNYLQEKTLFKELEPEGMETMVGAMFLKDFVTDELVIRQGRGGDFFYVIHSGHYRAYTKDADGNTKILKNYDGTGSFGELALMYNVPRHCSVKALTDGKLWVLDRETFKHIVISRAIKKRENHVRLLKSVPILKPLNDFEFTNVADSLDVHHYKSGDRIIQQGDEAYGMFFIVNGKVNVSYCDDYGLEVVLDTLSDGAYFGELALIENQRRAASVTATENVTVAFLHRDAFERLLGPCVDLMNRNAQGYEKQREDKRKAASQEILFHYESVGDDESQ